MVLMMPGSSLQGQCLLTIGSHGLEPGRFDEPDGLALTPDEAFLLVVDCQNRRVMVLCADDGSWVRELSGPPDTLQDPYAVAIVLSTGEVLVSDLDLNRVVCVPSIEDDTSVNILGTRKGNDPS